MIQKYYPIELLHWSAMTDEGLKYIKDILSYHPEYINTLNSYSDNALIIASRVGNVEIVKYLIENTEIDIHYANDEGNALTVALKNNKNNVIEYLLTTSIDISRADDEGKNALYYAALHNSKFFEEIFNKGVNINELTLNNENILFPLIENYTRHENYYLFNFIIENMKVENIFISNKQNLNILQYMDNLIQQAADKKEVFREQKLIKVFSPLKPILRSYAN